MTKVMLIASVAALAITTPALAGPHGGPGGGGPHGNPHASAAPRQNGGGGGRAMRAPSFARPQMQRAPRQMQRAPRMNFAQRGREMPQMHRAPQRMERQQAFRQQQVRRQSVQRQAMQRQFARNRNAQRQAMQRQQVQRQAIQNRTVQRQAARQQARAFQQQRNQQMRADRAMAQNRAFDRQQRVQQMRQQQQMNRFAQAQVRNQRVADLRQVAAAQRMNDWARNDFGRRDRNYGGRDYFYGCPPGLAAKHNGCLPPGQAMKLLGSPLSRAASYAPLAALPATLSYMYPESPDHYYRYGDGYLYGVNRNTDIIDSLMPLVGGGYLPGMAFPAGYMDSYVPDYYGMNSFYPDTSYADYRYLDGNVYSVDPYSGMIQDVIPTYAYGYGVGQMLPAGYGYYNVPYQYRQVYYDTPDYNYWYAPGAIYQVDPNTQLITSVASLLGPGLTIGQPLPVGYDTYNVPMAYRSTYYDTPTAWYRYNNGYIYQVDPTTQLVTAIVASLLT